MKKSLPLVLIFFTMMLTSTLFALSAPAPDKNFIALQGQIAQQQQQTQAQIKQLQTTLQHEIDTLNTQLQAKIKQVQEQLQQQLQQLEGQINKVGQGK